MPENPLPSKTGDRRFAATFATGEAGQDGIGQP